MSTEISVRPFELADRSAFLDLYESVYGVQKSDAWFTWKYESNPAVDHIPIMVATIDGTVVGVRPLFILPLRDEDSRGLGFEQSDALVAPDFRRRGIFSTLVEATIERYVDDAAVFFSFPNEASRSAYEKLGWNTIGTVSEGYRLQRPGQLLARLGRSPDRIAPVLDHIGEGLLTLPDIGIPGPGGFVTTRYQEPPVDRLAVLASQTLTAGIQLDLDRSIIEWRFRNPDWSYETLVASSDGEPTAAIIVSRGTRDGLQIARVADIVPRTGGAEWRTALEHLMRDAIRLHRDRDLMQMPLRSIPNGVGRQLGFVSDDRALIARFTAPTYLTVRSVSDGFPSARVESIEAWRPTFAEYDTA